MQQRTRVTDATKIERDAFCAALQSIAWGKPYNKNRHRTIKPYAGTEAQQLARTVLVRCGVDWPCPSREEPSARS